MDDDDQQFGALDPDDIANALDPELQIHELAKKWFIRCTKSLCIGTTVSVAETYGICIHQIIDQNCYVIAVSADKCR